jgi:hypothetical protein
MLLVIESSVQVDVLLKSYRPRKLPTNDTTTTSGSAPFPLVCCRLLLKLRIYMVIAAVVVVAARP